MDQQTRQHRRPIGHHLGLCPALAFGLTLGTQAAAAKERARETPLPADMRLRRRLEHGHRHRGQLAQA